jgi:hypothetical protein
VPLDFAVGILVLELQKVGDFAIFHPLRAFVISDRLRDVAAAIDRGDQVQARHRPDRRRVPPHQPAADHVNDP